jgi:hypothetical protein
MDNEQYPRANAFLIPNDLSAPPMVGNLDAFARKISAPGLATLRTVATFAAPLVPKAASRSGFVRQGRSLAVFAQAGMAVPAPHRS